MLQKLQPGKDINADEDEDNNSFFQEELFKPVIGLKTQEIVDTMDRKPVHKRYQEDVREKKENIKRLIGEVEEERKQKREEEKKEYEKTLKYIKAKSTLSKSRSKTKNGERGEFGVGKVDTYTRNMAWMEKRQQARALEEYEARMKTIGEKSTFQPELYQMKKADVLRRIKDGSKAVMNFNTRQEEYSKERKEKLKKLEQDEVSKYSFSPRPYANTVASKSPKKYMKEGSIEIRPNNAYNLRMSKTREDKIEFNKKNEERMRQNVEKAMEEFEAEEHRKSQRKSGKKISQVSKHLYDVGRNKRTFACLPEGKKTGPVLKEVINKGVMQRSTIH